MMASSESDIRAKLIAPALHVCGWMEDLIRREETAGAIYIEDGKPKKRSKGREVTEALATLKSEARQS